MNKLNHLGAEKVEIQLIALLYLLYCLPGELSTSTISLKGSVGKESESLHRRSSGETRVE